MIPWLVVADLLGNSNHEFDGACYRTKITIPSSGERNFSIDDVAGVLNALSKRNTRRKLSKLIKKTD